MKNAIEQTITYMQEMNEKGKALVCEIAGILSKASDFRKDSQEEAGSSGKS